MDKIKKAYVDSRFRTRDSNSDSDIEFEVKEHWIYQIILFVKSMTFQFLILVGSEKQFVGSV